MWKTQLPMIGDIRLGLLCVAWMAALIQVTTGTDLIELVNVGVIAFIAFVLLTLSRLRHDSALILLLLVVVGWALLDHFPDGNEWASGGRYVLIFTALLPTMALVRATASMMPSVHRTQDALAQLPASASSGGLHLAANIFGGIINTGALAILSAAIPKDADDHRRQLAAEAALRGMVTAAAWSPFFVAFAIGQGFVGKANSWIAIGIGGVTAILFAAISLPLLNRSFSGGQLRLALICLKPVLMRLSLVLGAVLGSALLFDFTALSAVVVVMPVLVLVQFIRYPAQIKPNMQIDIEQGHFFEVGLGFAINRLNPWILAPDRYAEGLKRLKQVVHHGGHTSIGDLATGMFNLDAEAKALTEQLEGDDVPFRTRLVVHGTRPGTRTLSRRWGSAAP